MSAFVLGFAIGIAAGALLTTVEPEPASARSPEPPPHEWRNYP